MAEKEAIPKTFFISVVLNFLETNSEPPLPSSLSSDLLLRKSCLGMSRYKLIQLQLRCKTTLCNDILHARSGGWVDIPDICLFLHQFLLDLTFYTHVKSHWMCKITQNVLNQTLSILFEISHIVLNSTW